MATLRYDGQEFEFDERLLAHVKIVITQKLRRRESFLLSWSYPAVRGDGRSSIWLNPSSVLHFRFGEARAPELNQAWLTALMDGSHAVRGLDLDAVPEVQDSEA